ncbi:hypothetical protein [Telmatospirillum siberiense]|nr:hypothetical protein [Telmatospirillum siberiense]
MTIPPASLAMATQQPQSLLPAQDKQAIVADGPIDGFGAQMPLDQAVHWIVPPGLSVTFDGVADRNLHVDWRGGTSWRQTLSDALAPVGLVANFTPQGVSITPPC